MLGQYRTLDHLNLRENGIQDVGSEGLARVLAKCAALAHLDLRGNGIGAVGAEILAGVLG